MCDVDCPLVVYVCLIYLVLLTVCVTLTITAAVYYF